MQQRLVDVPPVGYYTHNTGGEHTTRVIGDEHYLNRLRLRNNLPSTNAVPVEYARDHDGYVMIHSKDGQDSEMCGYVLARQQATTPFNFGFLVDEVLVDSPYRNRGIGKFLMGKLATKGMYAVDGYSINYPDSLVVPDKLMDTQTAEWFLSRGFSDDGNSLKLLLPGCNYMHIPCDQAEEFISRMPAEWNGVIEIFPIDEESSGETHVFREGTLIGRILPVGELPDYEVIGGHEVYMKKYQLITNNEVGPVAAYSDTFFAVIDLLNRPEL